ncbi:Transcription factor bHLH126 [Linum grandiflorum]
MFPHNSNQISFEFDANDNTNTNEEDDDPLIFFPSDFSSPFTYPPQAHLIFQQPPPPAAAAAAAVFQDPAPLTQPTQNLRNIAHRDVERQRRKEMADLHGSLRSLLPSHYIKGKRAASDHMLAAIDYIRELQTRTKELGAKRDYLKTNSVANTNDEPPTSSSRANTDSVVVSVRRCLIGMEVVINGSHGDLRQVSRVLKLLMQQGLNVVTFDSVRVNDRLIHTIQSEVMSESSCIDAAELQSLLMRQLGHLL